MNLHLNELYFKYKEEVMVAIQFMKNEYPIIKSIIYHEIGHVLQLFYICHIYKLDFRHVNYFRIVWLSTKHDRLMKKYFQSHNLSDDMILHYLGKSAFSDIWEVLPECYNNYYDFKVSEKPLNYFNSQAFSIVERIITDYKKYIPII